MSPTTPTTRTTLVRPADLTLRAALRLAAAFAATKLLITFTLTLYTTHLGYGYFRDEFYYIACGHHLAWGFVDHGPIVALQARLGQILFGDSVFAIRILSAAAGAAMIFLTGLLAWAMGGRRPSQALAMFGLILAPQFVGTDGYLSMNSFEPVFWMTCALALLLMLNGHSAAKWWAIFGLSAGVGLLNKPSMTFFLIALGLGLLLTPQRRILFTRWAALGIALMVILALPNLLWQIHNHWPTLEFLHNGVKEHKNIVLNPLQFTLAQFNNMLPLNALLWITGIIALLRAKSIQNTRWLGLTYVIFFALMCTLHAKDYYLAAIYPALFAAGAIAWEHRLSASRSVRQNRVVAFPIFESLLLIAGLIILPMASPILRPEAWLRYTTALHLRGDKLETASTGPLPQFYADRFGWDALTKAVVTTYQSLPPDQQREACILTTNYGEAGAIDLLGKHLDPALPPAIANQNSYWMWGTHGCTWKTVIFFSDASLDDMNARYESVQVIANLNNPYAMPFEHKTLYLCHRRRPSMPIDWNDWKSYI